MTKYEHPDTGKEVSRPVYEAIMAERERTQSLLQEMADVKSKEPVENSEYERYEPRQGNPLVGLLLIIVIIMAGYMVYQKVVPAPVEPDTVLVPLDNPDRFTKEITEKLQYQPEKARKTYLAYSGFSEALAGRSGTRVVDTRVFEGVTAALLDDIEATGGESIGRDIDEAVGAYLEIEWGEDEGSDSTGWEFKAFDESDREKLVEITAAIARAAKSAL